MPKKKAPQKGKSRVLIKLAKVYKPSAKTVKAATVKDWKKIQKSALKNPIKFWEEAAKDLQWFKPWKTVVREKKKNFFQWFIGGQCNIVSNALDRHMGTPTEKKPAIIWENDKGESKILTYKELNIAVCKIANGLKSLGVKKGDRVAIYLQNIPEAAISMLACAKIGAVHSVVYAGFAAHALRERIDGIKAKILITSDIGHRAGKVMDMYSLCDEAVQGCKTIKHVIVVKRQPENAKKDRERDIWFHELISRQSPKCETEVMESEDPLFILYNSGTASAPRGMLHVHGGYTVGINRTFKWTMDVKPDDVLWSLADPGWITGHSYTIYAPLIAGITTVMYEGIPVYPQPDRIWMIMEKYGVTILYMSPTLIRMLKGLGEKWIEKYKLPTLRLLGAVGEAINSEIWKWYYKYIGKDRCPIMDTWWQTETGMFIVTPFAAMPLKPGSAGMPFPGVTTEIVDDAGKKVPKGQKGYFVITKPWPAMIRTIYGNDKSFVDIYWKKFKGKYFTLDMAMEDKDGYYWMLGRSDDVIKIAGHRIGTLELETAICKHPAVLEVAVIGLPDPIKGEIAKAFVVLKKDYKPSETLEKEIKLELRKEVGPIAVVSEVKFLDHMPKTRSGKIVRRILKARELGQDVGDISNLAD
jgi:acetyl-CoA synthetase